MKPRLPRALPLLRPHRPLPLPLRRLNSTTPAPTTPTPPPSYPTSALTPLPHRRLLEVTGPDARAFLQGLTTIDVQHPTWTPLTPAALLSPQGRILFDIHLYHPPNHPDTFLLEHDSTLSSTLHQHLRRYKLRSRATLRLLAPDEKRVWASWGTAPSASAHTLTAADTRAPGLGWRHLANGDALPEVDAELAGEETYRLHRYLRGVAEGAAEIEPGRALVHEFNLDRTGAVNFRKGCYVGQELTIRTQHTGVVRRRVLPVRLYAVGEGVPGELRYEPRGGVGVGEVLRREGGKRAVGRLLGRVGNVGIASCRLEVMTPVLLDAEETPYVPGAEFVVRADGEEVGVRAFVPEWLGLRMKGEGAKE